METRFLRSESPPEGRAKYRNNIPPTTSRFMAWKPSYGDVEVAGFLFTYSLE